MEIADETTLLADASKFSKRGMHRIATLNAFTRAVVDDTTDAEHIAALRSAGLDVAGGAYYHRQEGGAHDGLIATRDARHLEDVSACKPCPASA